MGRLIARRATPAGIGRSAMLESADSMSGAGFVRGVAVATILESADGVAALGIVSATGVGSVKEGTDFVNSQGTVSVSGLGAVGEGVDVVAASGSISSNIGSGAIVEGTDLMAGTGSRATSIGIGAATELSDQLSGAGTVKVTGAGAITEIAEVVQGAGTVKVTGNGALVESVDLAFGIGSVGTAGYKFNPGDYAVSSNATSGTNFAAAQSDVNLILASGTTNIKGYTFVMRWAKLESGTNSLSPTYNFTVIDQILNYLWENWPTAHSGIFILGNNYGGLPGQSTLISPNYGGGGNTGFYLPQYITDCGGTLTVPNGFGSGSNTSYAVAPDFPGGPNYGADFNAYGGGIFNQLAPQWHNAGVMRCFLNMIQALSQHQMVLPNVPQYNGMTLDQCPAIEFIHINDEVANYWYGPAGSGNNFPSGTGDNINPPGNATGTPPVVSSPATIAQFWSLHCAMYSAMTSYFPHTLIGACDSWGVIYGTNDQTGADMAACVNANLPGPRSAPYALSTIVGLAMDCADTRAWDFGGAPGGPAEPNSMQNGPAGFIGVQTPGAPTNSWVTPTYPGLANIMPEFGQVQPLDYTQDVSGAGNNASAVQQISAAMNFSPYRNVSHALWWMNDSNGLTSMWTNYIYPTLQLAGIAGVRAAVPRPSSLSAPAAPTSVQLILQGQNQQGQSNFSNQGNYTPYSTSLQSIGWKAVAGATSYNIYRSTTTTAGSNGAYTLYQSGVTAAQAASNYSTYVANSGSPPGGGGGVAPGINCVWQDTAANNCLNGVLGPTSGVYYGPTTGYTYTVTAVAGGIESAQSAPSIAILFANGAKVFCSDTFNDMTLVWSQAAPSTSPLGFANATYIRSQNQGGGGYNYVNPFSGWGSPIYNFSVTGFNYLVINIYPTITIPANNWSFSTEVDGDIFIYGTGNVFFTFPANQWSTVKFPLWSAAASLPYASGVTAPFLLGGPGGSLSGQAAVTAQTTYYKTSWVNAGGGGDPLYFYYLECYFSVD